MTLETVKTDIADGRSTVIYLSSVTLWWTHLEADSIAATEAGKGQLSTKLSSEVESNQSSPMIRLLEAKLADDQGGASTVTDIKGNPAVVYNSAADFIANMEADADRFGAGGLDTFMKAHHQNCGDSAFETWNEYYSQP